MGLYKALGEHGINVRTTDVGDKYVYEMMQNENYCLGGEESGHIIFSKYASTGDGLITALKIMEVLIDSKLKASNLTDGFLKFPQLTKNIKVKSKDEVMNDKDIKNLYEEKSKELGDKGRILLRKSGTEPVIRVMAEAESEDICESMVDIFINMIKDKGYNV